MLGKLNAVNRLRIENKKSYYSTLCNITVGGIHKFESVPHLFARWVIQYVNRLKENY